MTPTSLVSRHLGTRKADLLANGRSRAAAGLTIICHGAPTLCSNLGGSRERPRPEVAGAMGKVAGWERWVKVEGMDGEITALIWQY